MAWVKDPLPPGLWDTVFARDGGCIAPLVDPNSGPCKSKWGRIIPRTCRRNQTNGRMTLDHVPPTGGAPRVSSERWSVILCWGHHAYPSYWETSHRDLERKWLSDHYPEQGEENA